MPSLPQNVVKRGSVYYFRMEIDGRDVRRSLGRDLKRATELARELALELTEGDSSLTVNRFSKRWLSERIAQGRGPGQLKTAEQRYRDYTRPIIGRLMLSEVRTADFRRIRSLCESRGLSPATVRHVLGDARNLFRYAMDCGYLDSSPFRSTVMPRLKQGAPKRLAESDVKRILAATPDKYQLPVRMALATGIRWGELHSLRWRHVIEFPKAHLLLENTKSGRVRRVPLGDGIAKELEARRGEPESHVLPFRSKWGPGHMVETLKRRSGVRFHWHQFRHTFACRYLEAGGTLASLQQILGHSTVMMTQRYAALSDASVFNEAQQVLGSMG